MTAIFTNRVYNLCFSSYAGGECEERMQQQADLLFYKFRFLFAGILTTAFLVLFSALVTAIGSHSILDAKTSPSADILDTSMSDNSNVVTASAYKLVDNTKHAMLSAGTTLYGACRSITIATAQSGRSIIHGSAVIVHGIGSGAAFAARGVGSSIMFTLRIPGNILGSVTHTHTVSAIIRPADNNPVPVINTGLSPALLARLNAQAQQDQQKSADLQAAQLAANRGLGGSIVAGDPHHGGYPSAWDAPTSQDSRLDSWGMYNRECVSFAAWKVYQTYGSMPYWGGVGNANQWVHDAKVAGIPTSSTPRVHSVAISMYGYYGHAMWVEAVSGNMVYVSQYNYDLHGHYSEMWVNGSSFTYIYFK